VLTRRSLRVRAAAAALALTGAVAAHADNASLSDIDYRLGSGLQIPGTGWTLGGYATVSYDDLSDDVSHESPRLNLDNFSLFIWWEGDSRWKFFSEIEYENFSRARRESGGKDDYLSLERMYVDYALNDIATIRGGKFLTPIGRWNLIHATPLVWTTSRPLVTTLAFPTNMTGLMVTGNVPAIAGGMEYSLYGAGTEDLRSNPDQNPFLAAVGGRVLFPIGREAQLGFSYSNFELSQPRYDRKHLYGADFFWTHSRFELSAEGIYRWADDSGRWDEKGGYVQLAAPLTEKLFAVGRAEVFRTSLQADATQLSTVGLNYRIRPALVLKAEWVEARHNTAHAPDGFLSSISVLF
jgi:hypothetical protein